MTTPDQPVSTVTPCRLCVDSGLTEPADAEVIATVPMAGYRPRYPLCHACLTDIEDACEEVTVIAHD